ncbi:unnamed protein product [Gordionus sp. m RMFG-2023]
MESQERDVSSYPQRPKKPGTRPSKSKKPSVEYDEFDDDFHSPKMSSPRSPRDNRSPKPPARTSKDNVSAPKSKIPYKSSRPSAQMEAVKDKKSIVKTLVKPESINPAIRAHSRQDEIMDSDPESPVQNRNPLSDIRIIDKPSPKKPSPSKFLKPSEEEVVVDKKGSKSMPSTSAIRTFSRQDDIAESDSESPVDPRKPVSELRIIDKSDSRAITPNPSKRPLPSIPTKSSRPSEEEMVKDKKGTGQTPSKLVPTNSLIRAHSKQEDIVESDPDSPVRKPISDPRLTTDKSDSRAVAPKRPPPIIPSRSLRPSEEEIVRDKRGTGQTPNKPMPISSAVRNLSRERDNFDSDLESPVDDKPITTAMFIDRSNSKPVGKSPKSEVVKRLEDDINQSSKKEFNPPNEIEIDITIPSKVRKGLDNAPKLNIDFNPISGPLYRISGKKSLVDGDGKEIECSLRIKEDRHRLKLEAEREWKRMRLQALVKWHDDRKQCQQEWFENVGESFLEDMVRSCDRIFSRSLNEFDKEAYEVREDLESFGRVMQDKTSVTFSEAESAMLELWEKQKNEILGDWEADRLESFKRWENKSDSRRADMDKEFDAVRDALCSRWTRKFEGIIKSWAEDMVDKGHNRKEQFALTNDKRRDELRNLNKLLLKDWEKQKSSAFEDWGRGKAIRYAKNVEAGWNKIRDEMYDTSKLAISSAVSGFDREKICMAEVWDKQTAALQGGERRQSTVLNQEEMSNWNTGIDSLLNKWNSHKLGRASPSGTSGIDDMIADLEKDRLTRAQEDVLKSQYSGQALEFLKMLSTEKEKIHRENQASRRDPGNLGALEWMRSHEVPRYLKEEISLQDSQESRYPWSHKTTLGKSSEALLRALITATNSNSDAIFQNDPPNRIVQEMNVDPLPRVFSRPLSEYWEPPNLKSSSSIDSAKSTRQNKIRAQSDKLFDALSNTILPLEGPVNEFWEPKSMDRLK